ncbi:hypothetical protein GCM10011356_10240 [Kangiella profundi]|nr:hypothetical protein GCM10011356_10240 [Kangiella profundi]
MTQYLVIRLLSYKGRSASASKIIDRFVRFSRELFKALINSQKWQNSPWANSDQLDNYASL